MKKILLILLGGTFILSACTDKTESNTTTTSARAERNIATVDSVSKAILSGDFSRLDSFLAPDVIDHASETGTKTGLDSVKADLQKMAAGMSGMKSEVIKALADDDYAMVWMRVSGTAQMDGLGMKKGEPFNSTAIEVAKFNADGKCTEHWTFMEPREMMKMMGGGMPMTGDQSKMEPPKVIDEKTKTDTAKKN